MLNILSQFNVVHDVCEILVAEISVDSNKCVLCCLYHPPTADHGSNGVFGKLPSHQMAVAIMCLIGKEIREIHFGHRALPYILCAYKYIQCL